MLLDELRKLRQDFNIEVQKDVHKYVDKIYNYTVEELKRSAKQEGSNVAYIFLNEAINVKCLESETSKLLLKEIRDRFAKEGISIQTNYQSSFDYDAISGDSFVARWEL